MKLGPALRQTALGGALVALIGSGLCCVRGDLPSGSSTVKTTSPPTPPVIRTAGGSAMVLIPSGTLLMGDRSGRPNEAPAHEVKVAAFSMDIDEVTQADFAPTTCRTLRTSRGLSSLSSRSPGRKRPSFAMLAHAPRASSPATTRTPPSATSPRTATACPPRRNGNTPAARAARRPTRSVPTKASSTASPGSKRTQTRRPTPSARSSPTHGACTTCTATCPSGATTSTTRLITRKLRQRTRRDRPRASNTSCAGGRGLRARTRTGPRTGWAKTRAFPTLASLATRSAFGAFRKWPGPSGAS